VYKYYVIVYNLAYSYPQAIASFNSILG